MGHHRQVNQGSTFYSSKDNPHHSEACQDLPLPHSLSTRCPKDYNIRQGHSVRFEILGSLTTGTGNSASLQYSLPPSDRWADGTHKTDLRRHAESMCPHIWNQLGRKSAICRVRIQQ